MAHMDCVLAPSVRQRARVIAFAGVLRSLGMTQEEKASHVLVRRFGSGRGRRAREPPIPDDRSSALAAALPEREPLPASRGNPTAPPPAPACRPSQSDGRAALP